MKLIEGEESTIVGVITRSKYLKGKYMSDFTDSSFTIQIMHKDSLNVGSVYEISGIVQNYYGKFQLNLENSKELPKEEYKKIEFKLKQNAPIKSQEFLINDELMNSLKENIENVARILHSAKKLNRNIIVRFHNDADGICGALALKQIIRANFIQQISAIYTLRDAMKDLNSLNNTNNPLLILVDFGGSFESLESLKLIKAAGIETLVIDHHPPDKYSLEKITYILNPWIVKENESSSKYSAGYLCSEIARLFGLNVERFAKISLYSDKSDLLDFEKEDLDGSLVLNFVAAYSSYSSTIDFYESLFTNHELYTSILFQAAERVEKLIEVSKHSIKQKQIGKFKVCEINLGDLVKKHEFPGLGKSATQVYDHLVSQEEPSLLVAHGPKTIVLRINKLALDLGADSKIIIPKFKETMENIIESGGGHSQAAAIRVKDGFERTIINQIEDYLSNL